MIYIKPGFIMTYLALMIVQCPKTNDRGTIVILPGTTTMLPPNLPDWWYDRCIMKIWYSSNEALMIFDLFGHRWRTRMENEIICWLEGKQNGEGKGGKCLVKENILWVEEKQNGEGKGGKYLRTDSVTGFSKAFPCLARRSGGVEWQSCEKEESTVV